MDYLWKINEIIGIIFCLCYFYQIVYIPIALLVKEKRPVAKTLGMTRYAILICARNEEKVIGDLIDSIHSQTYPQQYINIFVMADNCQDHTAKIAESHGAMVYTRKNQTLVGKGYALDALLKAIQKDHPTGFDGYLVLDSDNILKEDYLEK